MRGLVGVGSHRDDRVLRLAAALPDVGCGHATACGQGHGHERRGENEQRESDDGRRAHPTQRFAHRSHDTGPEVCAPGGGVIA